MRQRSKFNGFGTRKGGRSSSPLNANQCYFAGLWPFGSQ